MVLIRARIADPFAHEIEGSSGDMTHSPSLSARAAGCVCPPQMQHFDAGLSIFRLPFVFQDSCLLSKAPVCFPRKGAQPAVFLSAHFHPNFRLHPTEM
jgi:hypothetical protein